MALLITDIDDCILQFSDPMQNFLEQKGFVSEKRMRDYHDIPGLFNLTIPETLALVREFHRSPAMGQLVPEPCAATVLPQLYRDGYRFVAISACLGDPEVIEMRTRNLQDAFGFPWEAVHCIGLKSDKSAELKEYASSIWVEDMWYHAVAGAEIGHRAFIVDRLYNRNNDHPGVTRVQDWHEIAEQI